MTYFDSIIKIFVTISITFGHISCNCRYRSFGAYPPKAFAYLACWGCYNYTRADLFSGPIILPSACEISVNNQSFKIPGYHNERNLCIPFHYSNNVIKNLVEKSLKSYATVEKWIKCSQDAEKCCETIMMDGGGEEDGYCPSQWDGWSCYKPTLQGSTYEQVCSKHAYGGIPPRCHYFSYKQCFKNSTWNDHTDYTTCTILPRLIFRTQFHISMLALSIVVSLPAIVLLFLDQTLHQQKFILIRNLICAIVFRNFCLLITKSVIIMDELTGTSANTTFMAENQWPCKLLSFLEKLFGNAVFACMLIEGIYLHQLVTNVFGSRRAEGPNVQRYQILGAILAISCAISWSILMAIHYDENCWTVTEGTDFNWINDSFRLTMLFGNLFLLMHIMYTLWQTFHRREEEHQPIVRTIKAFLVCLPLFGIPFIFLLVYPDTDCCDLEQAYFLIYYSVEAMQGILIAILNIYTEKEIKYKISRCYKKLQIYLCIPGANNQRSSSEYSERSHRATFNTSLSNRDNQSFSISENAQRICTNSDMTTQSSMSVMEKTSAMTNDNSAINSNNIKYSMPAIDEDTNSNASTFECQDEQIWEVLKDNLPSGSTIQSPRSARSDRVSFDIDPITLFRNRADGIVVLEPR